MANDQELCTPVWMLVGMSGSVPGVLELAEGKVAFTSAEGRVFEAPLSEVSVKYPWYYFGGGCKITTGGKTYRISFVRPNNAADVPGSLLARTGSELGGAFALLTAGRKLGDIGKGRKAGKAWKGAFAANGK
jgi:hypothetical protein